MTQDSKPKYDTDYAILDVYRGGKYVMQLSPEKRVYFPGTDHEQPSTIVALHSTAQADLYTVFEGKNPDYAACPIIKAYLNPLIAWIWIGVVIVVIGTFIALAPNLVRVGGAAAAGRSGSHRPAGRLRWGRRHSCEGCPMRRPMSFPGLRGSPIFWAKTRPDPCCSASSWWQCWARAVTLRPHRPRADVLLRLRADAAGVQPRRLPRLRAGMIDELRTQTRHRQTARPRS